MKFTDLINKRRTSLMCHVVTLSIKINRKLDWAVSWTFDFLGEATSCSIAPLERQWTSTRHAAGFALGMLNCNVHGLYRPREWFHHVRISCLTFLIEHPTSDNRLITSATCCRDRRLVTVDRLNAHTANRVSRRTNTSKRGRESSISTCLRRPDNQWFH